MPKLNIKGEGSQFQSKFEQRSVFGPGIESNSSKQKKVDLPSLRPPGPFRN